MLPPEARAGFRIHDLGARVGGLDARLLNVTLKKHLLLSQQERLKDKGQLCCRLKQELDFVATISVHESVAWMRDCFKELLEAAMAWETEIENALEECQVNVKISEDAPWTHILTLRERALQVKEDRDEVRARLDAMSEQHAKDMEASLEQLSLEMEEKGKMECEKIKLECEEKFNKSLDEIRGLEDEKRESALEESKTKICELEASIMTLKQNILDSEQASTDNKQQTADALKELENLKTVETQLREKIESLERAGVEAGEQLELAVKKAGEGKDSEITSYQEQIRQHSVTICAMEEKLNKVVKKYKDSASEISTFKSTITNLRQQLAAKPEVPPKPKVIIQKPAQDVVAMEAVIAQLRLDYNEVQRQLQQSEDVIMGLRRDLAGASAKLTDMTGELSESQKEEIERHRLIVKQQDNELTECRQQLAKLSEVVDKQSTEIKELNNDLTKQRTVLSKLKSTLNEKETRMKSLEGDLETERGANKKNIGLLEEEGRITSELTALGAQCRGERHESVIARQREALTELRARVKALEMSNPPLPTKDQALQQVVLLKKELSEIRASQALNDTLQNGGDSSVLASQVNRARGIDPHARAQSEVERSAHRETMEALELSEESYLVLLRGVASSLEMDEIGGMRSMAHIPSDERARLARERETSCELVSSRVKVLKERIARKDELLQGYERDLAKLRQMEKLAEQKNCQVEALSVDMRSRTEESQYLRESLQRTKDRLDQERRLNTGIKSKKTFHMENERVQRDGSWPKHSCRPDDIMGKQNAQKKAQQERLKRKNYEISSLKSELNARDQDLAATRRRLFSVEASASLEPTRNPAMEPPMLFSEQ